MVRQLTFYKLKYINQLNISSIYCTTVYCILQYYRYLYYIVSHALHSLQNRQYRTITYQTPFEIHFDHCFCFFRVFFVFNEICRAIVVSQLWRTSYTTKPINIAQASIALVCAAAFRSLFSANFRLQKKNSKNFSSIRNSESKPDCVQYGHIEHGIDSDWYLIVFNMAISIRLKCDGSSPRVVSFACIAPIEILIFKIPFTTL